LQRVCAARRFGTPIPERDGGAERNRTAGLLIANEALSQLSYSPEPVGRFREGAGSRQAALIFGLFGAGSRLYKGGMLNPIAALLIEVLEIYKWIVIAAVIVSWLTAFNVINQYNNFVRTLLRILIALTEPVFRPIRKVLPAVGGLDLSPIVVFVIIWFLQYSITWASFRYGL
jgi:YggT family protein